jgi:hypothetical protein
VVYIQNSEYRFSYCSRLYMCASTCFSRMVDYIIFVEDWQISVMDERSNNHRRGEYGAT